MKKPLLLFAALLFLLIAFPALSSAQWQVLNGGNPIDVGGADAYLDAVATKDYVYYIFPSRLGFTAGRLNLRSKAWELFTDSGWSSGQSVIPKPLSISESVYTATVYLPNTRFTGMFEYPAGSNKVFGFFIAHPQIIPSLVDSHGALFNFILDDSGFREWDSGKTYSEYGARTLLHSWKGIVGSMAVSSDSAIAVGTYGGYSGKARIAAVRYFPDATGTMWKIWKNSSWDGWTSAHTTYTPVPHPEPPADADFYYHRVHPTIAYLDASDEYLLLFWEKGEGRLCAAKYSDAEPDSWKWWNGIWTDQGEFDCSDLSGGATDLDKVDIVSSSGITSVIILDSSSAMHDLVYDSAAQQWGMQTGLGDLTGSVSSYAVKKDVGGSVWLVYTAGDGKIKLAKKTENSWADEGTILNLAAEARIQDLVFFEGNTPLVFIHSGGRHYAYSAFSIGDQAVERALPEAQRISLDSSKVVFASRWINNVYDTHYSAGLAGHMAFDDERKVYAPAVAVSKLLIHDKETDSFNDGYFWGSFWGYFYFPSGVAVDNQRGKVYVSSHLNTGGAGGIYSGKVQVFDKSLSDQNLFYRRVSGRPVQPMPERIYPPTLTGFKFPSDVAVDEANGYLYVSDSMNHRIQKFDVTSLDAEGKPTKITNIGSKGTSASQFRFPQAVDVDSQGNLYVADAGNHRIQKFDSQGNHLLNFGSYGIGSSQLLYPYGLSADPHYSLVFITDPFNEKVLIFSQDGEFLFEWNDWPGGSFARRVSGIVAYGDGNVSVGYYELSNYGMYLARFSLASTADNDNSGIPDVFEELPGPQCGNGIEEEGEDCSTCPADVQCAAGEQCIAGNCIPPCTEGEIGAECVCGSQVVDSGYCCNGIWQEWQCDLSDCNHGAIESPCVCGVSEKTYGYCCNGAWQLTSCPLHVCGEGMIEAACLCSGTEQNSGYCCSGAWQAGPCQVMLPDCNAGVITSPCLCGGAERNSGFCCNGIWQQWECSLRECSEGEITASCVCEAEARSSGYCCAGIYQDVACGSEQCTADTNCLAGEMCCDGLCLVPMCVQNSECSAGHICINAGACQAACALGCETDFDCLPGQVCCSGSCQAPACSLDSQCDDSDRCTADSCINAGTCEAACVNSAIAGCEETPPAPSVAPPGVIFEETIEAGQQQIINLVGADGNAIEDFNVVIVYPNNTTVVLSAENGAVALNLSEEGTYNAMIQAEGFEKTFSFLVQPQTQIVPPIKPEAEPIVRAALGEETVRMPNYLLIWVFAMEIISGFIIVLTRLKPKWFRVFMTVTYTALPITVSYYSQSTALAFAVIAVETTILFYKTARAWRVQRVMKFMKRTAK